MDYRLLFLALVLDTAPLMIPGRIPLAEPITLSIVLVVSSILATLAGLAFKGTMNQDRAAGLAFLSLAVGLGSMIFMTGIWAGYGDVLAVCGGMPPEFLRGDPRCSGLQQETLLLNLSPLLIIVPALVFVASLLALRKASE